MSTPMTPESSDQPAKRKMFPALSLLEKKHLPVVKYQEPFRRPAPPKVWEEVHIPQFNWQTPYQAPEGDLVTLDISGAYLAAAATNDATFAHSKLEHTGARVLTSPKQVRPGYYLIDTAPWPISDQCPSPLGTNCPNEQYVWVAHPTVRLLLEQTDDENAPWPGVEIIDSYTAETSCYLTKWVDALREARVDRMHLVALTATGCVCHDDHDGASLEHLAALGAYDDFKRGYSAAWSMIGTPPDPKSTPKEQQRKKNDLFRPDWVHTVTATHGVNLWRKAYRYGLYTHRPLIALENTDEIVVERAGFFEAVALPRKPFRWDSTGTILGSVKIKKHGWDR